MSGLDLGQFKALIVRPTLGVLGLDGPAAINLLAGTALAESGLTFLSQIDGPALGVFQMEPATHDDCWARFLPARPALAASVRAIAGTATPRAGLMVSSLAYACAMARITYYRAPGRLPQAHDAAGLSAYHKQYYNTALGAANARRNTQFFQKAIDA
ncbi:hypothetical protein K2X14_10280 [Acetobacter sp. TBRC 12305]|uniref:Uncharacterized protein n=1 Tax=Acetobacter garciniae TaxID=2817435 RepID=A0A939KRS3_9PROT|nr:hypothetical protein [Acetobacter garciniae]MBO1326036.1 hypothetical protein [Acetobacter garciniae]MBX0345220.1 hypothetical protein [Acetobacter garciniae]